jgi:molecular chaperone GrpE
MSDSESDKNFMPEDIDFESMSAVGAGPADETAGRVGELEAEIVQMKDQILRALAETDNIRKRAIKEREDASKYSVTSFAREMIDIADNFQRAIDAVPAESVEADPVLKNLMDGIQATERAMIKALEKHGIKKVEPLGQPFDPNFHEVMFEAPMPGKAAGTVIQVIDSGYVIHDRLLRPARVGVAKGEDGATPHRIDETA